MDFKDILAHYSKELVKKEIIQYASNRWVAIHAMRGGPNGLFIRYKKGGQIPLTISNVEEFNDVFNAFRGLWPRTFYASVNIYSVLDNKADVEEPSNILFSTPIWDIDGSLDFWEKILEAARVIVDLLEKEGVIKSVYLLWSGRGIHVHIHERAVSQDVLSKYHPLDVSYSIVEYILDKGKDRILSIAKGIGESDRPLKVENEIDLKRVFTIPLSLHKSVDYAAVCFKPEEIDNFELEWAKPSILKHNERWREYVEGEADQLAIKAIKKIGGYFARVGEKRTVVQIEEDKKETKKTKVRKAPAKKIGRFQVMALLQAARYYLLTGDIKKAKSFGLNRAIFYAWAKHHGRFKAPKRITPYLKTEVEVEEIEKGKKIAYVGNEGAFVSEKGWFIIGDKEQLPEDFDREIADKIDSVMPFEEAWKAAIEYLRKFPEKTLLDQRKFFEEAYKKVRDNFIEEVVLGKSKEEKSNKTLLDFLQKDKKGST